MSIELKKISYNARMSDETNNYAADLYYMGKKIGEVGNSGQGGCDSFHGDHEKHAEANQWCLDNLPEWKSYNGTMLKTDLEMECGNIVDRHIALKDMKSKMRGKVLFQDPTDKLVYQIKTTDISTMSKKVAEKYPGAYIFNSAPEKEALDKYIELNKLS